MAIIEISPFILNKKIDKQFFQYEKGDSISVVKT